MGWQVGRGMVMMGWVGDIGQAGRVTMGDAAMMVMQCCS
jgi:hypothetical protein